MTTAKRPSDANEIRELVEKGYSRVATEGARHDADATAREIGYDDAQLSAVPEGANLGVGCGNPTAIDSLRAGEVVVDLGSGAGMDCFLASRQVGPTGRVIGIDMTDAMLEKARKNAEKVDARNVEFRKGCIEDLPLEDESVDVIISNCVINLSPEKDRVYREAYRVLRPGGRVMVSDIVLDAPLPAEVIESIDAYLGCVGGASLRADYLKNIEDAGFQAIRVQREASFGDTISLDDPQIAKEMERLEISEAEARGFLDSVKSLSILAVK